MDKKLFISSELEKGTTLEEIGCLLGVSKQRVYQLIHKFGLSTPLRRRLGYRTSSSKQYWLCTSLAKSSRRAGITRATRHSLIEYLQDKLPDICPVLGITLDYCSGNILNRDASPSIDRIDSKLGYTVDNVHIISFKANRIKNDATPTELRMVADYFNKLPT